MEPHLPHVVSDPFDCATCIQEALRISRTRDARHPIDGAVAASAVLADLFGVYGPLPHYHARTVPLKDIPQVTLCFDGEPHRHPQTYLRGVQVDEGIALLLSRVWDSGLETQWSCEGIPAHNAIMPNLGLTYIVFPQREHAYLFLEFTGDNLENPQDMMRVDAHMMTENRAAVTFPPHILDEVTAIWPRCPRCCSADVHSSLHQEAPILVCSQCGYGT